MKIGEKLKKARKEAGWTQEEIAEKIEVSRQTISNWENEKFYPDIISVIKLSDIYSISLDCLLKGDEEMMTHLEESTDTVKSNKKLLIAIGANMILIAVLITMSYFIPEKETYLLGVFVLMTFTTSLFLYELVKRN